MRARPRGICPQMTPRDPRRAGWLIVALGAIALGVLGAYLVNESAGIDPTDPGWAEVAWIISPILAAGASLAIGILLMLVAAFSLIDVALSRAAKATGVGCGRFPVLYLLSVFALLDFMDSLDAELAVVASVAHFRVTHRRRDRDRPRICGGLAKMGLEERPERGGVKGALSSGAAEARAGAALPSYRVGAPRRRVRFV